MSASVDRWLEGNASDPTALKAWPTELIRKAGMRDFSVNIWGLYTLTHTKKAGTRKKCSISTAISALKCAPCFPKSPTLESLFHKIVEERFKRTVLMPRQDKCTFQKRPSSTSFTSEDKKKKINLKHNEMRTDIVWCPSEIKGKKKKKISTDLGHHVGHIKSSQEMAVTIATHLGT